MLTFNNFDVFSINEVTPSFDEFTFDIRPMMAPLLLLLLVVVDISATSDGEGGNGKLVSFVN